MRIYRTGRGVEVDLRLHWEIRFGEFCSFHKPRIALKLKMTYEDWFGKVGVWEPVDADCCVAPRALATFLRISRRQPDGRPSIQNPVWGRTRHYSGRSTQKGP